MCDLLCSAWNDLERVVDATVAQRQREVAAFEAWDPHSTTEAPAIGAPPRADHDSGVDIHGAVDGAHTPQVGSAAPTHGDDGDHDDHDDHDDHAAIATAQLALAHHDDHLDLHAAVQEFVSRVHAVRDNVTPALLASRRGHQLYHHACHRVTEFVWRVFESKLLTIKPRVCAAVLVCFPWDGGMSPDPCGGSGTR